MLSPGAIRVVTFDLDDTLWDVRPTMLAAEQAQRAFLAARAPRLFERIDAVRFATVRKAVVAADPAIVHSVTRLRRAVLQAALLEAGYAATDARALSDAAFAAFLEARLKVTPFEGVEDLLADLSVRYRLGAVSNGNADVRKLAIGRHFAFTVSADEIGRSKPDPAMFDAAIARAGVTPESILHVGDHPEHDIDGAHRAGFATAWVRRDLLTEPTTPADLTIASVLELRTVLLAPR